MGDVGIAERVKISLGTALLWPLLSVGVASRDKQRGFNHGAAAGAGESRDERKRLPGIGSLRNDTRSLRKSRVSRGVNAQLSNLTQRFGPFNTIP